MRPRYRDECQARDAAEELGLSLVSDWDGSTARWHFYAAGDGAYPASYPSRSGRLFQAWQEPWWVGR